MIRCLLAGLLACLAGCGVREPALTAEVQVRFSPRGGCTQAIIGAIDHATATIRLQAYSFTSAAIANALVEAHRRGVAVRAILDASQRSGRSGGADILANAGIPVLIDDPPAIAHSKVLIIDDALVITGSFNFTRAAEESNVENLLLLRSPSLAARYTRHWHERAAFSVPYQARAAAAP